MSILKKTATMLAPLALGLALFAPSLASASVGVSVNTSKIVLDKDPIPGNTYELPTIQVKNSGSQASDYGVSVEYNEVQSQIKPDASWLVFSPASFHLAPGESKIVKISMVVPKKAAIGNYFAYIEAHSIAGNNSPVSSISGAAATKLYFSIAPSGRLSKMYYSAVGFINGRDWVRAILWLTFIIIFVLLAKRVLFVMKGKSSHASKK